MLPHLSRHFHHVRNAFPHFAKLLHPTLVPRSEHYTSSRLRRDIFAGLTVAAILIPNTLAYALLAGLPPVMGLYAALPAVLIATLWGSSMYTITAPVGVVSLLTASVLTSLAPQHTAHYITLAITLAVLVGIMQLCFGLFRLGVLTRLISHATLVGFTNAAACIIAVTQVPLVLGIPLPTHTSVFDALTTLLTHTHAIHIPTAILGVGTICIVLVGKRYAPKVPISLLLILAGATASMLGLFNHYSIAILGSVPAGLPQFSLDAFSMTAVSTLLLHAVLIALVGFVETYSISQALAKKNGQSVDANKELVGQGLANAGAGVFGGFPVSGSFSASALNAANGATSRIAAVVAACAIFLSLLLLAPYLSFIPRAILGGVVIAAVSQLISITAFVGMFRLSPSDGIIGCVTAIAALLLKPDTGLIIGISCAIGYFILRSMNLYVYEVGIHTTHNSLWVRTEERKDDVRVYPRTLVARLDSSLLFANADLLQDAVFQLVRTHELEHGTEVRTIVMNCNGVNSIDLTGIENLLALRDTLSEKGVALAVMVVKDAVLEQITTSGFFDSVQYIHGTDELRAFCEEMEK